MALEVDSLTMQILTIVQCIHRFILFGWLVLIGLIVIAALVALINCFDWRILNGEEDNNVQLEIVSNFVGGMVGILAGFYLEWLVFEKFKTLSKYEMIVDCVSGEINHIEKILSDMSEKQKESNQTDQANQQSDQQDKRHLPKQVRFLTLDDVVLSIDSSSVVYELPSWLLLRKDKRGAVLIEQLQILYAMLKNRNNVLECLRKNEAGGQGIEEDDCSTDGEPFNIDGKVTYKENAIDAINIIKQIIRRK